MQQLTRTEYERRDVVPGPSGWALVTEDVAFVPRRVPRSAVGQARTLLDRDGAVLLTGWPGWRTVP